jgi:PAS domain S-box-containing protein
MNETATCDAHVPAVSIGKEAPSIKGALALLIVILLLCGGAGFWMFDQAVRSAPGGSGPEGSAADASPAQLQQYKLWTGRALIVASGGGVCLLITFCLSAAGWRRKCRRRLEALEAEHRKKVASLEALLGDHRKSEEQLIGLQAEAQKSIANLNQEKSLLQEELNKLKKSERTLSQERQTLESSRAVLELHVQARTKELQKLQRRYEHILNSAGEGICGLDVEGRATFVNPAMVKLTGWSIEELVGKPGREIFGPAANGSGPHDGQVLGEQVFQRKDGSSFPAEFVRTSINENGHVVGEVLLVKDITERKRVENTLTQKAEELARSNGELEQFAFVASHDLQEPLRKIQAFGDRLKTKCEALVSPEARDYLERMQNAASRMRCLIDDLLAFSRAIRSTEPFVPVDLGRVAKEVLSDLEVLVEKNRAQVELGELPTIDADPMQMHQLLLNLIGNALKFQPPGGTPRVKVSGRILDQSPLSETRSHSGQRCELYVEDNGIGFEEQYTEKIFAVFQRLHGRNEYEGSGIGLAVCRRITDRHHGKILARSQLGKGSTFIITLPARQPKPSTPE